MITTLETLRIAGFHPDVGAYPFLLVAAIMLGVIAAFGGRR